MILEKSKELFSCVFDTGTFFVRTEIRKHELNLTPATVTNALPFTRVHNPEKKYLRHGKHSELIDDWSIWSWRERGTRVVLWFIVCHL